MLLNFVPSENCLINKCNYVKEVSIYFQNMKSFKIQCMFLSLFLDADLGFMREELVNNYLKLF